MKDSEESDLPQDEIIPLEEKKKDPISQFFLDMKGDIQGFSQKSDEF